jgi:hypothetical protein
MDVGTRTLSSVSGTVLCWSINPSIIITIVND